MNNTFYESRNDYRSYLAHYGVKGMKWKHHKMNSKWQPDKDRRSMNPLISRMIKDRRQLPHVDPNGHTPVSPEEDRAMRGINVRKFPSNFKPESNKGPNGGARKPSVRRDTLPQGPVNRLPTGKFTRDPLQDLRDRREHDLAARDQRSRTEQHNRQEEQNNRSRHEQQERAHGQQEAARRAREQEIDRAHREARRRQNPNYIRDRARELHRTNLDEAARRRSNAQREERINERRSPASTDKPNLDPRSREAHLLYEARHAPRNKPTRRKRISK